MRKAREKLEKKNDIGAYYRVVNNVKSGEAPKVFDIMTMKPGLSAKELADDVVEFFNLITRGYTPLEGGADAGGTDLPVKQLEHYEVASRLRRFKKNPNQC